MNDKNVLLIMAALLIGGSAGFLLSKKLYEKYYADIAQEEIDSVKAQFKNYKAIERAKTENVCEEENKAVSITRSLVGDNPYEQAKRNYSLYSSKQPDESDEEDEDDEPITDAAGKTEFEMVNLTAVDRTEPYIIDDRAFTEEFDHHDKISLYYYKEDDVLCGEDEAPIDNIEETVSYAAISVLDMQSVVWVRNERLRIDYEIISVDNSYAETVFGTNVDENLSPRERYLKAQKERAKREN